MAAMNTAATGTPHYHAKILDELLGKERNLPPEARGKVERHWWDDDVCKHWLVAYCPYGLFTNTKSSLGPCPGNHDPYIKTLWEAESPAVREKYTAAYEGELMVVIERAVAGLDRKLKQSQERLAMDEAAQLGTALMEELHGIEDKVSVAVDEIRAAADAGRVDAAAELMNGLDALMADRQAMLDRPEVSSVTAMTRRHELCMDCGALTSTNDNIVRKTSHLEGRQHTGFLKIRATLADMRRRGIRRLPAYALAPPSDRAGSKPGGGRSQSSQGVGGGRDDRYASRGRGGGGRSGGRGGGYYDREPRRRGPPSRGRGRRDGGGGGGSGGGGEARPWYA